MAETEAESPSHSRRSGPGPGRQRPAAGALRAAAPHLPRSRTRSVEPLEDTGRKDRVAFDFDWGFDFDREIKKSAKKEKKLIEHTTQRTATSGMMRRDNHKEA
jgi:hypothetical protein